jgi:hypothetical protein
VANSFIATADASGDLCVYTSASTDVIVDVVGATTSIDGLHKAQRLVDTRLTGTAPAAGGTLGLHAGGPGEVVMGTVTVDRSSGPGFVTVYPCADGRPNASNLNFVGGQAVANSFIATADASGDLCVYTSASTDVIVDVVGATTSIDGLHNAQRLVDTRIGKHVTAWGGS